MSVLFNYDISARDVLFHKDISKRLRMMKQAGVERVWLFGYFYGRHESSEEDIFRARLRLEEEGFQTGIISLPVGHPGNSLNPDDPELELRIKSDWTYRVGANGENEYFSACINDVMTRDNREAARSYAQMGFQRHFFDDDLRLGNWGDQIRGCFCKDCILRFNEITGAGADREMLRKACDAGENELGRMWMDYNCKKLAGFMSATRMDGMQSGVMLMHNADERHGISIPMIKKAVPDCMFRVGEMFFDDESFSNPDNRQALIVSVKKHRSLIGDNETYSETTVFPAAAMSPDNFIRRMEIEISLGLRNIFLMSGTWFYTEPYWERLGKERTRLAEMAEIADAKEDA